MVDELKQERMPVELACREFSVSKSGYYAWKSRAPSERAVENQLLLRKIQETYRESRSTYGAPRIYRELKEKGIACGRHRVARLMRINGIKSCTVKRFKVVTTDSNHDLPIAERKFEIENAKEQATAPNKVWVGDITYVPTNEGWLYLAVFLDVFTRKVVGFAMKDHMRTELVAEALHMALGRQANDGDLLAHTDRGSQYASDEFRRLLREKGITASMSRRGNCYDNAFAESFFGTLKTELVYPTEFETRIEAMRAIFEFIEVWYNRKRRHSALGYRSPIDYETQHLAA